MTQKPKSLIGEKPPKMMFVGRDVADPDYYILSDVDLTMISGIWMPVLEKPEFKVEFRHSDAMAAGFKSMRPGDKKIFMLKNKSTE